MSMIKYFKSGQVVTIGTETVNVENFGKNILLDAKILRQMYRETSRYSIVDTLCNKMHMKIEAADETNEYLKKHFRSNK